MQSSRKARSPILDGMSNVEACRQIEIGARPGIGGALNWAAYPRPGWPRRRLTVSARCVQGCLERLRQALSSAYAPPPVNTSSRKAKQYRIGISP